MPIQNTGTAMPSCETAEHTTPTQLAAVAGGDEPHRGGDQDRQHERDERQRQGHQQPLGDLRAHRQAAHERRAEVEAQHLPRPRGELLQERLIRADRVPGGRDLLGGGADGDQRVRRVTRQHPAGTNVTTAAAASDTSRKTRRRRMYASIGRPSSPAADAVTRRPAISPAS
ncbi:hypothetical protein [Microbacterium elymi]|uniref:Uncharacterized protein n=1 Tax=Microbacterium elymi TaxID=2909587 RepID=A0ABY5NMM9_9MICO|nr:hypothetical protein [Microbacterium elymi]UUT36354.1 hypothetical protein L2X98_25805 [Microbacterium elymi]